AAHPEDVDAWTALGDVERKRCRLGLAQAAYERALERDPADAAARAGLAEALLLAGEPDAALAQAQLGIDVPLPLHREEDGRPWRMKALALVELRRYDLAVAAAERAVALRPDDARCTESLAASLFRARRMDECRATYFRAVALDPRAEEANLRLGNGFGDDMPAAVDAKSGEVHHAWEEGEDAPAFRDALAAWDRGDLDDVQARFLDLLEKQPRNYKFRLGLGLARLSIRRRGEAWLGRGPA